MIVVYSVKLGRSVLFHGVFWNAIQAFSSYVVRIHDLAGPVAPSSGVKALSPTSLMSWSVDITNPVK